MFWNVGQHVQTFVLDIMLRESSLVVWYMWKYSNMDQAKYRLEEDMGDWIFGSDQDFDFD
jgi:hypothetical protein